MADINVNDFVSRLTAGFLPEKAKGVDATIQLNLSGTHAGAWNMVIQNGQFKLNEGLAAAPQLTVSADSDSLVQIFKGELDGMQAYLHGKIKIAGDMSLAMKLLGMFKLN